MTDCPDQSFGRKPICAYWLSANLFSGLPNVPPLRSSELSVRTPADQTVLLCNLNASVHAPWRFRLAMGDEPVLPEPARSSLESHWLIRQPNRPQAQAGRLSSAFFPFSDFQPILIDGLRQPTSRLSRFDVQMRPCGFLSRSSSHDMLMACPATAGRVGHASPASFSATFRYLMRRTSV